MSKTLFDTVTLGDLTLKNRIAMASMSRGREDPKTGVVSDLTVTYFAQRAQAGILFTGSAPISVQGNSAPGNGYIFNNDHVKGWKKVTDAVHANDSRIFIQLVHGGRQVDTSKTGQKSIAPSALPIKNYKDDNVVEEETPQEITKEQMKQVIGEFVSAAKLAKEAGFDGIELHCANGFLLDQFIRSESNKRTDEYGGSAENRCRFPLEVIDAVAKVWPLSRIGVKISPVGRYAYMYDENPVETYTYFVKQLDAKGIAYIQATEPGMSWGKSFFKSGQEQLPEGTAKTFRKLFKGLWIANEGFDGESGAKFVAEGNADIISFGKAFINNPDLPTKLRFGLKVTEGFDMATAFFGTDKGYTDFPVGKTYFEKVQFGDLTLQNRIAMASMTRCRADPKTGVPNDLIAQYYAQRSSAGLIFTEATPISNQGNPNPGAPCIYNKDHVAGWKKVTDVVHKGGAKIFVQLWHGGRVCKKSDTNEDVLAPSALAVKNYVEEKVVEEAVPKEMNVDDMKKVIAEHVNAAKLAKEAGFDGIEVHCANGYLLDEFLRSESNKRTDDYGGSVEKRARFPLEVIDAVLQVWPANRVGVKISPVGRAQYMYDENPLETYSYFLTKLSEKKLLYVQATEPGHSWGKTFFKAGQEQFPEGTTKTLRKFFKGLWVANEGITPEAGVKLLNEGLADVVSFAKYFLNNPDLVARIRHNWSIDTNYDWGTAIGPYGEKGFTDRANHENNKEVAKIVEKTSAPSKSSGSGADTGASSNSGSGSSGNKKKACCSIF